MKDGLIVLATAAVAVACCFGVSLLAAAGTTTLLGVVGVALPIAVLFGIVGWMVWYLMRRADPPRGA